MAVEGPGSTSNADGYFKEIYADNLENLVPEHSVFGQDIAFREKEKLGDSYHMPVRVRRGHGVTFAGPSSSMGAFTLNAARSGKMLDARVEGSTFVGREDISYKAVMSADSKRAFGNLFDDTVKDLMASTAFYRELCLLYGGGDIGVLGTEVDAADTDTEQQWDLTAASSCLGIFAQMEGALIDIYSAAGAKRNAAGTFELTGASIPDGSSQVRLTIKASDASELNNCAATDVVLPAGAKGEWFTGLETILKNDATLFNIDASVYSLWKANTHAVGGALTMDHVQKAAEKIVPRAGLGDLSCYVSVPTWRKLNSDIVGMRQFTEGGGVAELGAKEIRYHGPGGTIAIKSHPMLKAGLAMMGDPKGNARRVGASDITFELDGVPGAPPKFLRQLANKAGYEIRIAYDQALVIPRPAGWTVLTGITN